jgi:hypothetical protein
VDAPLKAPTVGEFRAAIKKAAKKEDSCLRMLRFLRLLRFDVHRKGFASLMASEQFIRFNNNRQKPKINKRSDDSFEAQSFEEEVHKDMVGRINVGYFADSVVCCARLFKFFF